MKVLVTLLTLISATAQAEPNLSREQQNQIVRAVYDNCSVLDAFSVKVQNYTVTAKPIDQGQTDYYYSVEVLVSRPSGNEGFVRNEIVKVKAAKYAISNPTVDSFEILSVKDTRGEFGGHLCN